MALERRQGRSRAGVPQPDRPVVRCRRQQLAVRREGHGLDPVRMALERLQQGIPIILDLWLSLHPFRHAVFELLPHYAHRRCKHKRTTVRLKGSLLDRWSVVENETLCVMDKFGQPGTLIYLNHILAKYSCHDGSWLTAAIDSKEPIAWIPSETFSIQPRASS
jgi:hypothetical protein